MHVTRIRRLLPLAALSLFGLGGCPQVTPNTGQPALATFNIPDKSTRARIRGGDAIVYVVIDEQNREFDFYLAKPGETAAEHQLIGTVPAADFGFTEGETLVLPQTISFTDNLERGVVGFESGSYVINANTSGTAQLFVAFEVTPLTAFGEPVFAPAIAPLGNRIAFETPSGDIGVAEFNGTAFVDRGVIGPGTFPTFSPIGQLGFVNPSINQFQVGDFNTQTINSFGVVGANPAGFATPFDMFEAGFTPGGIGTIGTLQTTTPLLLNTPFALQ